MTVLLVLFLAVWVCSGLGTGFVMGRRGYDAWSWSVLGVLFGPVTVPLAIGWHRRNRRISEERVLGVGSSGAGPISVLVGVDGSAESLAATSAVVDLLGARLSTLTLATVVDFDEMDAVDAPGGRVFEQRAQSLLDTAATRVSGVHPTTVVLSGRPADSLIGYARRHGINLVAIGARGRGLSEAVLGSVAEQLVRTPDVLVLVAGRVSTAAPAAPP